MARSRGTDWVFNFLTTFYADPANRQTGVNNLQLPGTAMPHVLSSVQGVQNAVWRNVESTKTDGAPIATRAFEKFEPGVVGSMTAAQYDEFVRDTVNFLQYVGDPTQLAARRPRPLGGAVPSHVHVYRVPAEEGILEGRPLSGHSLIAGLGGH